MNAMKYVLSIVLIAGCLSVHAQLESAGKGSLEVINAGVGGNTSGDLLKRINQDVIPHNPDLVVVMVGTNDMVNSGKLTPYDVYRENLSAIVDTLLKNKIQAVLMSPPPVDTVYLFSRHDRAKFKALPNEKLDSVRKMMAEVALEEDLLFVDLQAEFTARGLPKHNADSLIKNARNSGQKDGVHPTPQGYAFIGQFLYGKLKQEGLIDGNIKIVCFGDSITYGSRVEGAGTSTGDTYPAVLLRLIEKMVE